MMVDIFSSALEELISLDYGNDVHPEDETKLSICYGARLEGCSREVSTEIRDAKKYILG